MKKPSKAAAKKLALGETLDLPAAIPLAAKILKLRGKVLRIDASNVAHLGGQCLQVLLSAAQTWRADDVALTLRDPSPEFLQNLALFGIAQDALSTGEAL